MFTDLWATRPCSIKVSAGILGGGIVYSFFEVGSTKLKITT
jgi:hypothetical protein